MGQVMDKAFTASVTQRGQVTIPAEVMRLLGVKPREKVVFEVHGNRVELMPARFTVETLAGSVQPIRDPADLDEQVRQAKEERAARLVRKMRSW